MSSPSPQVLLISELKNRLVLDLQTSETVGRVSRLLLDPPAQQIVGFECSSGLLSGSVTYHWRHIKNIGADGVVISAEQDSLDFAGSGPIPAPIGHEIWTDLGNKVGKVVDLALDPQTGRVTSYIFASGGWQGVLQGTYQISPTAVTSIGSQRMVVLNSMAQTAQQYSQGLTQKADQVASFIKEDYQQTKEDLAGLQSRAQGLMETITGPSAAVEAESPPSPSPKSDLEDLEP